MSYRHEIPPAKNKEKNWHGRNFWSRAEWAACETCGAQFWRTHNAQRFCNPKCQAARLTDADKLVVNLFIETCKRYRLPPPGTFYFLTHTGNREWSRFSKPERYRGIGKARKDRFVVVLKKFLVDLKAGWYDIEHRMGTVSYEEYRGFLTRRMTPGQPFCPMKLPTCAGGLNKGDCPRRLSGCAMTLE